MSNCRGCLAENLKLYHMHEYGLADAYVQLMGAQVASSGTLSCHLCSSCCVTLKKFMEYRQRCVKAQEILQYSQLHNLQIDITLHNLKIQLHKSDIQHIDITPADFKVEDSIFAENYENTDNICSILDDVDIKDFAEDSKDFNKIESKLEDVQIKDDDDFDDINDDVNDDVNDLNYEEEEVEYVEKKIKPKRVAKKANIKKKVKKELKTGKIKKEKPKPKKVIEKRENAILDTPEKVAEFERLYNVKITILSKEEQLRDVLARKESSNYINCPYKCHLCFKGFLFEPMLKNHMDNSHNPEKKRVCDLCGSRFRYPSLLLDHLEAHRLRYACNECDFMSAGRSNFVKSHYKWHQGQRYPCEYCDKVFEKRTTHHTHIRMVHHAKLLSCNICGAAALGALGLKLHMAKTHRQLSPQPEYSCSSCGVLFHTQEAMSLHLETSPDGVCVPDTSPCVKCGENFESEDLLENHVKLKHKKIYKCELCDKTFKTMRKHLLHLETMHPTETQSTQSNKLSLRRGTDVHSSWEGMCEICGKTLKTALALRNHILCKHRGERPYKCTICLKDYATAGGLQIHIRKHTGIKPYKCLLCHKSFSSKPAFNRHQLVHSDERAHKCQICEKSFKTKVDMNAHIKTVHMKIPMKPRIRNKRMLL